MNAINKAITEYRASVGYVQNIGAFLHYWLMLATARLCVPVLRFTGWRFSKAWRGNPIVCHVAANCWADGYPIGICKFFNKHF